MSTVTFSIKSVLVQNAVMGIIMMILLFLLFKAVKKHSSKHILAVCVWIILVFWFFNSSLWGFSAVTISPDGLELHYGTLSVLKNTTLPVDTSYKIKTYRGGVKKMKKLYYLQLAGRKSMKVHGQKDLAVLQNIGRKINRLNDKSMGNIEPPPLR